MIILVPEKLRAYFSMSADGMETYLVGGAVRDELLELPVKERDWVVVGSDPAQMIQQGYRLIGKDFPVFLHPKTQEEYALARTERKTSHGYRGFQVYADQTVTLAEDLSRRDLTINAIAKDQYGQLIDPFEGVADLKRKRLRHVSSRFSEDPVRILRLARFAAMLPDFSIDDETLALADSMIKSGEVDALVAERVWQEWYKALAMPAPWRFFEVLTACGALSRLMPELSSQIDWRAVLGGTTSADDRFVVLASLLAVDQIKALCQRFRVPIKLTKLARSVGLAQQKHMTMQAEVVEWLHLFNQFSVLRGHDNFMTMMHLLQWSDELQALADVLLLAYCSTDVKKIVATGLLGKELQQAILQARTLNVQSALNLHRLQHH